MSDESDIVSCVLEVFLESLQTYMATANVSGKAIIASDALHAWEYTQSNENFPKAVLLYMGDELRADYPLAAIERITRIDLACLVSRNRGLTPDRGASLTQPVGNGLPLYKIVGQIRDIIRCQTSAIFIEMPVDYKNTTQWNTGPYISDAYSINFSVPARLPAVSLLNTET